MAREVRRCDDRHALEGRLRHDAAMHLYELGDLDDFFWPHTTYYVLGELEHVALLYRAPTPPALPAPPVLLLLGRTPADEARARRILTALATELPSPCYSHLMPGIASALGGAWRATSPATYDRMVLVDRGPVEAAAGGGVVALGPADVAELRAFYARAYPKNWFDPRMLDTGAYFGARRDGELASVSGVHVVSARYGVAALGNIATDPAARGQGLARTVTARTGRELLERGIETIGLNVESTNAPAIALYRSLGFERVGRFEEATLTRPDVGA